MDKQFISNFKKTINENLEKGDMASVQRLAYLRRQMVKSYKLDDSQESLKIQYYHNKLIIIKQICFLSLILISFFQRPTWCHFDIYEDDCSTRIGHQYDEQQDETITSNFPIIHDPLYYSIEITLMIILILFKYAKLTYQRDGDWIVKGKQMVIALSIITIICSLNGLFLILYRRDIDINLDVILKPTFILLYNGAVRRKVRQFWLCFKSAVPILLVWMFNAVIFMSIARIIFQEIRIKENFFLDIKEAAWMIFVLSTTNSYPDMQLPFYKRHRLSQLFFIAFLLLNYVIIINMIVSVFYSRYKQIITDLNEDYFKYDKKLDKHIETYLKNTQTAEHEINKEDKQQNLERQLLSALDDEEVYVSTTIFYLEEYDKLAALALKQTPNPSPIRQIINKIVLSYAYQLTLGALAFINFVLCLADESQETKNGVWIYIIITLNTFFVVEEFFKLFVLQKSYFQQSIYYYYELVISFAMICSIIIYFNTPVINYQLTMENRQLLEFICLLRIIRAFLGFLIIEVIYHIFGTLIITLKTIGKLVYVLLIVAMVFGGIGMILFGGKIHASDAAKLEEAGINPRYVYINFNDMWQSVLALWDLIMVNNLDAITNYFVLIMNNNIWYRLFFFIWYLSGVLIILNIVVAVIIDNVVNQLDIYLSKQKEEKEEAWKQQTQKELQPAKQSLFNQKKDIHSQDQHSFMKIFKQKYEEAKKKDQISETTPLNLAN